ncbi:MAG: alpha-amylase family glycosyl hydrolase, partial [Acutalibacteraceae bacterium]
MNRTKKLASLLLALSLVFSMFAFSVNTFGAVETDLDDVSANAETAASGEDFVLHDTVEGSTILHAFCWSYDTIKENLPDIARAGFTAVQTSPVQQPKDVGTSNDISGQWSKMYQPLSFSIAKNSWIGTKAELQSLCEEADKYGIKIICDIVSNHLAQEADLDGVPAKDIADYEPEIYNNQDKYFHSLKGYTADTSLRNQVQGLCSKCPDLNTGDEYVQSRVISLLKECIDCGVDGFRFDAAKHIETPDDKIDDENDFSSDFWPNITSAAEEYYRDKTGSDLYMYGEVLGNPGSDSKTGFTRQITSYTKYIDITDSNYSKAIRESAGKGSASSISKVSYSFSDLEASDIVAWVESHDNYEGDGTESLSNDVITKAWAVIAARKDSTGLFFARPGAIMGDSGDTNWKSTAVCEINKFHNIFASVAEENVSSTGVVSVVERGSKGAVIVNFGVAGTVEADVTTLANGVYTDAVSGNLFTVSDGKVTGEVGKSGVAVIYEGAETTPRAFVNKESGSFKATSLSVDITLENAISGTYSIDGGTPVNFENSASVNLGAMSNPGDVITLTVTATNGSVTTENTYKYTKEKTTDSGIFIYFQNFKGYKTPYIYAYLEDGKGNVLSVNRNWPGEPMDYDEEKGLYYYEITEDIANNGKVIFSNAGSSQYPSQTAKDGGLLVENESMILTTGNKWQTLYNYTTVPLGDFDQNEKIEIADVTAIQKHMAKMAVKSSDRELTAGDVNGDGVISIKDGTAIQKYLCSITLPYKIGERVDVVSHSTTDSNSLFYVVDKT